MLFILNKPPLYYLISYFFFLSSPFFSEGVLLPTASLSSSGGSSPVEDKKKSSSERDRLKSRNTMDPVICACACIILSVCLHECACACSHACVSVFLHTCVCVCLHACACVCVRACACIRVRVLAYVLHVYGLHALSCVHARLCAFLCPHTRALVYAQTKIFEEYNHAGLVTLLRLISRSQLSRREKKNKQKQTNFWFSLLLQTLGRALLSALKETEISTEKYALGATTLHKHMNTAYIHTRTLSHGANALVAMIILHTYTHTRTQQMHTHTYTRTYTPHRKHVHA